MNYQHDKHAGNYGDLLKHSVLCQVLQSLTQQDKPLFYSETHAGAGGYRLDQRGVDPFVIEQLWGVSNAPQALADYLTMVAVFNRSEILQKYPGSPWFAQQLLGGEDRMRLFELSPEPYQQLEKRFSHDVRVELFAGDGYSGMLGPIPGKRGRSLVLIDPPYESVSDYSDAVETLLEIYRREPQGCYLLWYPTHDRQRIESMEQRVRAGVIDALCVCELAFGRGDEARGSGLFILNADADLIRKITETLAWLAAEVDTAGTGRYRVEPMSADLS